MQPGNSHPVGFYYLSYDEQLRFRSEENLPSPTIDLGNSFESLDKTTTEKHETKDSVDESSIPDIDTEDTDLSMQYMNIFALEEITSSKPEKKPKKGGIFHGLFRQKSKANLSKRDQNGHENKSSQESKESNTKDTFDSTSEVSSLTHTVNLQYYVRTPTKKTHKRKTDR